MARVTGLEPATSGVTGRRSNRLSYTRALDPVAGVEGRLGEAPGAVNVRIAWPIIFLRAARERAALEQETGDVRPPGGVQHGVDDDEQRHRQHRPHRAP